MAFTTTENMSSIQIRFSHMNFPKHDPIFGTNQAHTPTKNLQQKKTPQLQPMHRDTCSNKNPQFSSSVILNTSRARAPFPHPGGGGATVAPTPPALQLAAMPVSRRACVSAADAGSGAARRAARPRQWAPRAPRGARARRLRPPRPSAAAASTSTTAAPSAAAGRTARRTATASAPAPRDRAPTRARGTTGSRCPGSTRGPGDTLISATDCPVADLFCLLFSPKAEKRARAAL